MIANTAERKIKKLVIISEKKYLIDFPKYPNMDPARGKNNKIYSI
jgi:hypothetical protein